VPSVTCARIKWLAEHRLRSAELGRRRPPRGTDCRYPCGRLNTRHAGSTPHSGDHGRPRRPRQWRDPIFAEPTAPADPLAIINAPRRRARPGGSGRRRRPVEQPRARGPGVDRASAAPDVAAGPAVAEAEALLTEARTGQPGPRCPPRAPAAVANRRNTARAVSERSIGTSVTDPAPIVPIVEASALLEPVATVPVPAPTAEVVTGPTSYRSLPPPAGAVRTTGARPVAGRDRTRCTGPGGRRGRPSRWPPWCMNATGGGLELGASSADLARALRSA